MRLVKTLYMSIPCIILIIFVFTFYTQSDVYGQIRNTGNIGQNLQDDRTQVYVKDVNYTVDSGAKLVYVSVIVKNIDKSPQQFTRSDFRLVDSQVRQYEAEFPFSELSVYIPSGDTLRWDGLFKIFPSNNFSKLYFTPFGSDLRFSIDLTKEMNPEGKPPVSDWVLSSNKGIKFNNQYFGISINDEMNVSENYIVDMTIENTGNSPVDIDPYNFKVKDEQGKVYTYNAFFDVVSPLLSTSLPPGEKIRGDIAFDVKNSTGNKMIIYSTLGGEFFLNSGANEPEKRQSSFISKNNVNESNMSVSTLKGNGR